MTTESTRPLREREQDYAQAKELVLLIGNSIRLPADAYVFQVPSEKALYLAERIYADTSPEGKLEKREKRERRLDSSGKVKDDWERRGVIRFLRVDLTWDVEPSDLPRLNFYAGAAAVQAQLKYFRDGGRDFYEFHRLAGGHGAVERVVKKRRPVRRPADKVREWARRFSMRLTDWRNFFLR